MQKNILMRNNRKGRKLSNIIFCPFFISILDEKQGNDIMKQKGKYKEAEKEKI